MLVKATAWEAADEAVVDQGGTPCLKRSIRNVEAQGATAEEDGRTMSVTWPPIAIIVNGEVGRKGRKTSTTSLMAVSAAAKGVHELAMEDALARVMRTALDAVVGAASIRDLAGARTPWRLHGQA